MQLTCRTKKRQKKENAKKKKQHFIEKISTVAVTDIQTDTHRQKTYALLYLAGI
jgi:hypothetical protein